MAKNRKANRKRLEVGDVLAGRGRAPSAKELVELIHEVNPSGLGLPAPEMARRYGLKSRLQSMLIRGFASEIEVEPDAREPGVVGLRYGALRADACHALIRELDDDARSWVQRQVDLQAHADALGGEETQDGPSASPPPARASSAGARRVAAQAPGPDADLSVAELVRVGQEAIEAYDYELARDYLSRAFDQAAGSVEAALPLLSLYVDHIAADQDALQLQARLAPAAMKRPEVRRLLALAAGRLSERDRAGYFLQDDRSPAAAEVYVALARAALDAGALDDAAGDLAKVREICPGHALLAGLAAMVTERRDQERRPFEEDVARLVAERRLEEAEARGQAILARWPDSAAAKRSLREIDELRAAGRARSLLGSAEEALAKGEVGQARSLLQQALATGVRGEDAARIQKRIGEIEAAEQAAAERAQEERVVRLLGDSDLMPGLLAYAALDGALRRKVREKVGMAQLGWLDQMAPAGSAGRARAAVAAVLALGRASRLAGEDPAAALELLDAHARILEGCDRSEQVGSEARRRLEALERQNAVRGFDEARAAFDAGAIDRARELLTKVAPGHLPERERAMAGELHTRIEDTLEVRRIERLFRDGALLRARRAVDRLLERLQGLERARLEAVRQEIRAAIQQAFRVKVDRTPRPCTSLRDISPRSIPSTAHVRLRSTGELLIGDTQGVWVFLRLVDLDARVIRARVTLRTPAPMRILSTEIDGECALLIDQFGSVLEVSLADWSVIDWRERLGFETDSAASDGPPDRSKSLDWLEIEVVQSAALAPGTRMLWYAGPIRNRWFVRVVDLLHGRVLRDLREASGPISLRDVHGLNKPYIAVVRHDERSVTLYEPHGAPVAGSRVACEAISDAIVTYPGQQGLLLFTGKLDKTSTGAAGPTPIRWCTMSPPFGSVSPEQALLDEVACADGVIAAVDAATGMVFLRVSTIRGDKELIGLRACGGSSPGLEQIFRVTIPVHVAMLQGWEGQGVMLLAASEDRFDVVRLGPEPPVLPPGPRGGHIEAGEASFWGTSCHVPTGARHAAAMGLSAAIRAESRPVWLRRIEDAKRGNDPDRLLDLCYALDHAGHSAEAGELGRWAHGQHPGHVELQVVRGRMLANRMQWDELRSLLAEGDPSSLNDGSARHFHHLRGVALLLLGEPDEALRTLTKGQSYPGGRCEFAALIGLCTPLPQSLAEPDDSGPWTADQAIARTLMRAIRAADACLERGDAAGARLVMDRWEVIQSCEVQSLARLADAYLREEEVAQDKRLDKAFALAAFRTAHAEIKVLSRCELSMPTGRWDPDKLDDVFARATQWLDATLGEAWPMPPGGL